MLLASLDAGGRIGDPAGVLARVADFGGEFRILLHPLFPVGVEIGAEDLCGFGLRGRGRLRLGEGEKRKSQKYSGKTSKGENADHVCLLADLDNSLSRSRASMTMTRAVSSMPMAVLSTRMASRARTSGETLRSLSRLSRSWTSSRTSSRAISSCFSRCSFQRRSARTSGEASRKILSSAWGKKIGRA